MIQQGAHSWLTAPHPSVAFSISVRPNGIRSVIIRLFTVHAGLTVNFWDMRPLSSSNLFFSELQRRFISPVLTARMSRPSSNWHTGVFVQVPFHSFLITDNFLPFSGAALNKKKKKKVPKGVCTYRHKWACLITHSWCSLLTVLCRHQSGGGATFKFLLSSCSLDWTGATRSRHMNNTVRTVTVDRKRFIILAGAVKPSQNQQE